MAAAPESVSRIVAFDASDICPSISPKTCLQSSRKVSTFLSKFSNARFYLVSVTKIRIARYVHRGDIERIIPRYSFILKDFTDIRFVFCRNFLIHVLALPCFISHSRSRNAPIAATVSVLGGGSAASIPFSAVSRVCSTACGVALLHS